MGDRVLTQEEHNHEFTSYLQVRLFGLVANVEDSQEVFPMASGVLIQVEGCWILLTVAHYLEDLLRWKNEKRLANLFLNVFDESGSIKAIPLDLDKNPATYLDVIDVGFVMLNHEVMSEISEHGGKATRIDALSVSAEKMERFFLVGHASFYCKVARDIISTDNMGSEWHLTRLKELAIVISRIRFEPKDDKPGTIRFALMKGYDDYSGASGGPILGYTKGALIRDYTLFAIQSEQVLSASNKPKPTHLIATPAAVAIHYIEEYIRELKEEYKRSKKPPSRKQAKSPRTKVNGKPPNTKAKIKKPNRKTKRK